MMTNYYSFDMHRIKFEDLSEKSLHLYYIVFLSMNMVYVSLFLTTSFMSVSCVYYIYIICNLLIHLNNLCINFISTYMLCRKYIFIFN